MLLTRVALAVTFVGAAAAIYQNGHQEAQSAPVATSRTSGLGDLSALRSIATDTQALAAAGDMAGAKARIADFETAWDDAEPTMRPRNPDEWAAVDAAADDAIGAIRGGAAPADTAQAVTGLIAQLANPGLFVNGVATADVSGRAVPCEDMLAKLRAAEAGVAVAADVADLEAKGTERCNADDDARADAFFADAIAKLGR